MVIVETGGSPEMAYRPGRTGPDQNRIAVAISADCHQFEYVSRGLALAPEFTAAATEEHDLAQLQTAVQRLAADIAEHQHAIVVGMLHAGRQQSAALFPVKGRKIFVVLYRNHCLTSMPSSRRKVLSSGIAIAPE